jgi:hypothetical protein
LTCKDAGRRSAFASLTAPIPVSQVQGELSAVQRELRRVICVSTSDQLDSTHLLDGQRPPTELGADSIHLVQHLAALGNDPGELVTERCANYASSVRP